MKKSLNIFAALTIISAIALTGCGSTDSSASNHTNTTANTSTKSNASSSTQKQTKAPSVKEGVTKILSVANELKTEIASGDEAKVKETGPKLEDIWSSFEDRVKPKYPDLYEKVEEYLDPTVAGSKISPLDKETLTNLDNQLIQVLDELAKKVK